MRTVMALALALGATTACGGGGDGEPEIDAAAPTIDAAAQPDAPAPQPDAGPAGPVDVTCAELPATLAGEGAGGGVYNFGTLCYSESPAECRLSSVYFESCVGGRVLLNSNIGGGDVYFNFGFPTEVVAATAGTFDPQGSRVYNIPIPGTTDIDINPPSGATVRLSLNFTAAGSLTVTSFAAL